MYQVEMQGEWAGLRRIPFRSRILFYVWWKQDRIRRYTLRQLSKLAAARKAGSGVGAASAHDFGFDGGGFGAQRGRFFRLAHGFEEICLI